MAILANYALSGALRADAAAFFALSTFAVNVIALTEELFPRKIDVYAEMLEKTLRVEQSENVIYLYQSFFRKDFSEKNSCY